MHRMILHAAFVVGAVALGSGCVARVEEPVAYAEADYVPEAVTTYPSSVYEGRTVYYYGDRWYYRDGGRWAYYRREPPVLYRRRTYVQAAPPAPRVYAPPAHGPYAHPPTITSAPVEAPPAHRVR
jgi:hypothetical protein